jgi:hypothetical protein
MWVWSQYVCVKCEANDIRQKSSEEVLLVHRPSILHDGLVSAGSLFWPMSFIWSKLLLYLSSICNVVKMVNQIDCAEEDSSFQICFNYIQEASHK